MSFPDAIKLVLEGATVTKSSWTAGCKVWLEDGIIKYRAAHDTSRAAPFWASSDEMQAHDWEPLSG